MGDGKSQFVRLLDVFVFGPLMLRAARDQESQYFAVALSLIGLGTIIYNGVNYLEIAKRERAVQGAELELGQRVAADPRRVYYRARMR